MIRSLSTAAFFVLAHVKGRKLENRKKNFRVRTRNNNRAEPTCDARFGNGTQATPREDGNISVAPSLLTPTPNIASICSSV